MYNAEMHSLANKRKQYSGKSRMDIFLQNINPNAPKMQRERFAQYLGEHTQTTIRRNQYVAVQYNKYQLSEVEVLSKLQPNNYAVDACWFNETDEIQEVYLYQNGKFLCVAKKIVEFVSSQAEWTDADTAAMTEQAKYISHYDREMRENRKARIKSLHEEHISVFNDRQTNTAVETVALPVLTAKTEAHYDFEENFAEMGIENL